MKNNHFIPCWICCFQLFPVALQGARTVSTSPRCLRAPRWRPTWKCLRKSCTLSTPRVSRARRAACSATPTCACTRAPPWACTSKTLLPQPFYLSSPATQPPSPPGQQIQRDQKAKDKLIEQLPAIGGTVHENLLTSPRLHAFSFLKAGKMERSGRCLFALCISWSVVSFM